MCQVHDNPRLFATEAVPGSCLEMRRALMDPSDIEFACDEGDIFLTCYDGVVRIPVKFCPFCGTPMELV